MKCRYCGEELQISLVDLGCSPPSNAYLDSGSLHRPEKWFPLRVLVCENCWLAQTEDFASAEELFNGEYAYFSSFSSSWLNHARYYVDEMVYRFGLGVNSHVIEVAANDGYLLQYVMEHNIPCTGIEPTESTANAAKAKNIDIIEDFFGIELARKLAGKGKYADLMVANNVLAHVPDINDFVKGFAYLLKPDGVATFEFPHLMQLIDNNQFDTIYHEHFSYLSLNTVKNIFRSNGLSVFDVSILETHGGSLRVFVQRSDSGRLPVSNVVSDIMRIEIERGLQKKEYYLDFQSRVEKIKNDFILFLMDKRKNGKKVAAYGAAAKGNTLINFAGVKSDLLSYVVDRNPAKQGKFLPGSRIPIVSENIIIEYRPDYVIILPWNIKDEIMSQLSYIRRWGGQFVTAIPFLLVQ